MSVPTPTLRSLAKTLGLSRTTVSDALRGSPRVDPNTAARVKIAAAAAGYLRNPLAGALMSELRRSRGGSFRGVLAAVDFDEPDRPASAAHFHHELVLGAETRGAALGFKVEKIIVGRGAVSVPRLDSILKARGIQGIVLLPSWGEPDLAALDWPHYAGIYADYIIERPALHSICSAHYRSLLAALQRTAALGYQRPGLYLQRHHDERLQYRWSAAFHTFQQHHPSTKSVPPLVVDKFSPETFTTWFRRHQPDVVFAHHTPAIDWMSACGARLPETHGFVSLNTHMKTRPCAGLDLQPRALGSRGVELLIGQLQRNERGIPDWPSTTTIPAQWVDGPTLRTAAAPR